MLSVILLEPSQGTLRDSIANKVELLEVGLDEGQPVLKVQASGLRV